MRLLLDTHILIWLYEANEERLSRTALQTIADPANTLFLSSVSIWEIAIKISRGRLDLPVALPELLDMYSCNGGSVLALTTSHALVVQTLPDFAEHRDPFDRVLIAQAIVEDMAIVTADAKFTRYDVKRIW